MECTSNIECDDGRSGPTGVRDDMALVTIVSKHDVNDVAKIAAALSCSQYIAVESGSCYSLVCQCQLQEVASSSELYTLKLGPSLCVGLWQIEFERGRHYVVVGPAVGDQPNVPLLDIMTRVERERHGRDPIYRTPGWTDPLNQRPPSTDTHDPRKIGMPLDAHRVALRVVSVFDILDDWSLSDLLKKSRYIAVQGDWRKLGAKLSLEPAHRRHGFWVRRYPHVVGVYLGHAHEWGEYTFVGPSADSLPQTPLPQLLALLKADLRYTQTLAEEALAPLGHHVRQHGGDPGNSTPPQPREADVPRSLGRWGRQLYNLCVHCLCWRPQGVGGTHDWSHRVNRVSV